MNTVKINIKITNNNKHFPSLLDSPHLLLRNRLLLFRHKLLIQMLRPFPPILLFLLILTIPPETICIILLLFLQQLKNTPSSFLDITLSPSPQIMIKSEDRLISYLLLHFRYIRHSLLIQFL